MISLLCHCDALTACSLLLLLLPTLLLLLLHYHVLVRIRRRGNRLDVATDHALVPGLQLLALRANHIEVMADQPVAANRAPVGCGRERADDTGSDKNREVEAVLRVPFGSCNIQMSICLCSRGKQNLLQP